VRTMPDTQPAIQMAAAGVPEKSRMLSAASPSSDDLKTMARLGNAATELWPLRA
jgi:hypothetical protein